MEYEVKIVQVEEQWLATARTHSTLEKISQEIGFLLEGPWDFIYTNPDLRRKGHNVAIYRVKGGVVDVEVGVQVVRRFEPTLLVDCSATPAGQAAWTVHYGPYSQLGEAHQTVQAWCQANGHKLAGPSWEVYGDWEEDPAKLRTDVYWLLA